MNIVDSSTYTNQYQLLINSSILTTYSTLQTIQQNVGFNKKLPHTTTVLSNLNISGNTTLNNASNCVSSLNVSENTKLNNATTCISSLKVSGITILSNNIVIGGSAANNILQVGKYLVKFYIIFIFNFFICWRHICCFVAIYGIFNSFMYELIKFLYSCFGIHFKYNNSYSVLSFAIIFYLYNSNQWIYYNNCLVVIMKI